MAFTIVFYALAAVGLLASLIADRHRTWLALKKAWKAFLGILPEFLMVLIVTGLALAYLSPQVISRILGRESGLLGVLGASLIGSITLIPGFVAFHMAALLLQEGAGLIQIGAFVSALMMVGVVTFPVEKRIFGLKIAVTRNLLAFCFSLCVAAVLALVLGALS